MSDPNLPSATSAEASSQPAGLAIAGLVVDFLIPPAGLILSILSRVRSRRAQIRNRIATVGIALGVVFTIAYVGVFVALGVSAGGLLAKCSELGPGTHIVGSDTYSC